MTHFQSQKHDHEKAFTPLKRNGDLEFDGCRGEMLMNGQCENGSSSGEWQLFYRHVDRQVTAHFKAWCSPSALLPSAY